MGPILLRLQSFRGRHACLDARPAESDIGGRERLRPNRRIRSTVAPPSHFRHPSPWESPTPPNVGRPAHERRLLRQHIALGSLEPGRRHHGLFGCRRHRSGLESRGVHQGAAPWRFIGDGHEPIAYVVSVEDAALLESLEDAADLQAFRAAKQEFEASGERVMGKLIHGSDLGGVRVQAKLPGQVDRGGCTTSSSVPAAARFEVEARGAQRGRSEDPSRDRRSRARRHGRAPRGGTAEGPGSPRRRTPTASASATTASSTR